MSGLTAFRSSRRRCGSSNLSPPSRHLDVFAGGLSATSKVRPVRGLEHDWVVGRVECKVVTVLT